MKFIDTDLNDNILDALYDMRFEECTPIQEKCIPEILAGRDLLGVAQTGTGKTAAYLLPILSLIDDGGLPTDAINCVIMSPTRELAQQIDQAMQGFSYYLDGVSSIAIYGGNDGNRYDQELKGLTLGADVVIATPGRLISHLTMGHADFSKVSFFILDEADRMLDMGFSEDILKIAKHLPDTCQTIMFSATMPEKIEQLAKTLLKNPVEVKIAVSKPAEKIKQSAYVCYEPQKNDLVKHIFQAGDLKRVIIFSGKKQKVKVINRQLIKMGINSGEMHSDLTQAERDDIMYKFKSGQIDVLVATDIVSRGIDIDDIAMVINYDVPRDAEDYVHRIGRTARAQRDGVAITFVSDVDMYYFNQIERLLEKTVEKTPLPEGLGGGPEYKTGKSSSQGGRTSAKSRRRKDRDQQAHKHKPRRGNATGDTEKKERQPKAAPVADAPAEKAKSPQDGTAKGNAEKTASRDRKPQRGKKGGKPQEGSAQAKPQEKAEGKQAAEQSPNKRRRNRHHRRPGNRPAQGNGGNGSEKRAQQAGRPAAAPSRQASQEAGGLKSILKKPLSWIKGFGKK